MATNMTYKVNGVDISNLIYGSPNLIKKVGKGSKLYTNNLIMNVINEDNIFSPESEDSFLYDYRDDYSKIEIEVLKDDMMVWEGVVDNLERDEQAGTVTIICVESIIKVLSSQNFIYYSGDGYVGNREYAGDDATPAEHQLAILRRYLDDDNIDVGSLKVLKEVQTDNSVEISCQVLAGDNQTPISYLTSLMMDMGYFKIQDNKISAIWYENFTGDLGIQLKDDHIIDIKKISKDVKDNIYYSFDITYDVSGSPIQVEGSFGDNGTSTDCTSTALTDSTQDWNINEWKDKYIFVGSGSTKEILKITGNNKTTIYFQDCTKSGVQAYVIVENDQVYQKDYSDFPIKLTSGAAALGSYVVSRSPRSRLKVELQMLDIMNVDIGDSLLLNIPDEGIEYQSFEIVEINKKLEEEISSISCTDNSIYPLLEDFEIVPPDQVTDLTGYRVEGDGSAILSWTEVTGASYYKIYYGVSGKTYSYITPDNDAVNITENLEKWLGYYFWVVAVNFYGIEGETSDPLYLERISQASGYIDGTDGYLVEDYEDWGILEDYHYLLTYKNIGYGDIGFLLKCPLDVLDRSQNTFVEEITQPFEDQQAAAMWGARFRRLGYTDGAGTSTYLPELLDDGGTYKIQNPMTKPLTLNGVTYAAGAEITGSEDWFLKDGLDEYYTYWFETGIMMDIAHPDAIEWFKVWKIDKSLGIWESGDGAVVNNATTKEGTLTDTTKSWNSNQWEDYYIGIVNSPIALDIDWYKIKSNTATQIKFDYGGSNYTSQAYIINNEPYIGFHGIFVDDVWTAVYRDETNLSEVDNGTAEDVDTDYLQDTDKDWTPDHWEGFYVSINGQTPILIEGNDEDELWFTGNTETGTDLPYQIMTQFEVDNGFTYGDAMADFIESIVEHTENRSYDLFRDWERCEKGIFMLNTWPDDFSYYDDFVAAVNKRYQHFVMFEALQMTWDLANEVTKQFIVLDWHESISRWDLMKISAGVGNARLAILGYPYNQQMYLTHLAGSFLMANYGNNQIEDITAGGNIVLDQLFYDMIMAGNEENNKTIGFPESGYESGYTQNQYDRYGICYRKFEGCHIFYNPSRQIRTLEYQFSEDVVNYFTGEEFEADTLYTFILPPRTPIFLFRNSAVGTDAMTFLSQYLPYTYVDSNMGWVVFTEAGATLVDTESVWIENGYTGNKRFILDGDQEVPDGEAERLFHAGDGSNTYVNGHDPETENITGLEPDNSVLLTSKTVIAVVKIHDNTDAVDLVPGTDYLVEQKEWDASASGKGKWNTYIYFLTDQDTDDLDVYYYEYGEDGEGWPQSIVGGDQAEHGVLYRKSSGFKLKTGDIAEGDCSTYLTEGTHYYVIPEIVRHKWDYRIQPYGVFGQDTTFNAEIPLNLVYSVGGNNNIRGIHWGIIDAENAIMIKDDGSHNNSDNGAKATYSSKTITRPKVLIYGFTAPPRDEDTLEALTPAAREVDEWTLENQMKKYVGIYYDEVWVTGDWDGVIETGSNAGQWGSVQGIINDSGNSLDSWQDVADYFDVIIINDTFLEYESGSISGRTQWCSWMDEIDYNLIKGYKKRSKNSGRNTILVDRRMGATAFVWWGGNIAVDNILLNKGSDLQDNGITKYSDLTDVFGCLYYAGQSASDLANSSANVYVKAKSGAYVKYSDKLTTDYRIGKSTVVTDHYTFDESDAENHPILNIWENGGDFISYIPKTENGRNYIPESRQIKQVSDLYLKWKDLSSLESGENNFDKYEQMGLNNIILRREPLLIYHHWNFFNVINLGGGGKTRGNNKTWKAISYPDPILSNYGNYRGCFFSKVSRALASFFINKYIFFREVEMDEFKEAFQFASDLFSGYKGHYINGVSDATDSYPSPEISDYGWCHKGEFNQDYLKFWGWFFPVDSDYDINPISFGDVIQFDSWNDEVQENYNLSKATNSKGIFPYKRDSSLAPPLEGNINQIVKSGDSLTFHVDFDVSGVDIGAGLTEGTITNGVYLNINHKLWRLSTSVDVSDYRDGNHYIHIDTGSEIKIIKIENNDYFGNPPKPLKNTQLVIIHSVGDPDKYNGDTFEIREGKQAYRLATFLTNSDNNLVFNASITDKDPASNTLTIVCPRGVSQSGSGGNIIAYVADEDEDFTDPETQELRTKIANKEKLGGRVVGIEDELGADIAETFRPEGILDGAYTDINKLEALIGSDIAKKPSSMFHYEWIYKNNIVEFGYEKNTGLVACQLFYAHQATNRPPVLIWPGMAETDIHTVIAKHIGTKVTFNNLQVSQGDTIYFYYNSFNDMLRIKDEDVESPLNGHFKSGSLKSSDGTLIAAIVKSKVE